MKRPKTAKKLTEYSNKGFNSPMSAFIKQKETELLENANSPSVFSPMKASTVASPEKRHKFEAQPKLGQARRDLQQRYDEEEGTITNIIPCKDN